MFDVPEEENPEARPFTQWLTKDSGVKSVHSDGVQRDTQQGKTLYPLMFPRGVPMKEQLLVRVAELYTRGAERYGGRNWENSRAEDTLEHHLEALWRHFMNFYFDVQDQEDHAAAIVWNINAVELTRRHLREAVDSMRQPVSFDDSGADLGGKERENPIVTILKDIHNKRLSDEP